MANRIPGLDFDFLRYMGVRPENQRRIQGYYLSCFAGCQKVLDLGCGDGDFVELLLEQGVDVVGIDSDEKTCKAGQARGLPIVQRDVFEYLRELPSDSVNGIFCAHMVEHLPYLQVIELISLAFRVLAPGGVIVLATPDVRALVSHLEMFYLHFGHVSFYHARLLCFFLEHEGFVEASFGVNPETASPLLAGARSILDDRPEFEAGLEPARAETGPAATAKGLETDDRPHGVSGLPISVSYRREIPPQGRTFLHRLSYHIKRWLAGWLIRPFMDDLASSVNRALAALTADHPSNTQLAHDLAQEVSRRRLQIAALEREVGALRGDIQAIAYGLQTLDGPFECYATAFKLHRPAFWEKV